MLVGDICKVLGRHSITERDVRTASTKQQKVVTEINSFFLAVRNMFMPWRMGNVETLPLFVRGYITGLLLLPTATAFGPKGNEFQVNSYIKSWQTTSAVATLADGGFIATWSSYSQDGNLTGIYGKRYVANWTELALPTSGDGRSVRNEFRVNSYTANDQNYPAIAPLTDGGFVVMWSSADQDGDGYGVYGKRYGANGTEVTIPTSGGAVENEFRVNSYTTSWQTDPSIAPLTDGGFVAIWTSYDQDGDGDGIYGKRYSANGTEVALPTSGEGGAIGNEFRINSYTLKDQNYPAIASLPDGSFIVTWASDNQDGDGYGVYGKRYDALGTELTLPTSGIGGALGNEFRINSAVANDQKSPAITILPNGGFVVIWESVGIHGKFYDVNGAELTLPTSGIDGAVGNEFRVNSYPYIFGNPTITSLTDGGFVVMWVSDSQRRFNTGDIYGKRYFANGTELALPSSGINNASGNEFWVRSNTDINSKGGDPTIVSLHDGSFVATWTSYEQDGDDSGIYGKRYDANGTELSPPLSLRPPPLPTINSPTTKPPATVDNYEPDLPLILGIVGGVGGGAICCAILLFVTLKGGDGGTTRRFLVIELKN